jgi:hypothetical protein
MEDTAGQRVSESADSKQLASVVLRPRRLRRRPRRRVRAWLNAYWNSMRREGEIICKTEGKNFLGVLAGS